MYITSTYSLHMKTTTSVADCTFCLSKANIQMTQKKPVDTTGLVGENHPERRSVSLTALFSPPPCAAEELCTLVITEAFPEDSGLFKCMAVNPFGSTACSALLEVYNGRERPPPCLHVSVGLSVSVCLSSVSVGLSTSVCLSSVSVGLSVSVCLSVYSI